MSFSSNEPDTNRSAAQRNTAQFVQRRTPPVTASQNTSSVSTTIASSRQQSPESAKRSDSIDLSQLDISMTSQDTYTGLGQYPSKYRKLALKSWLRLASIFLIILGLGYLGITLSRPTSKVALVVDPRLESKFCDIPHPGRPLIQYVLMVDAGSTGSRIHVYKFNYCKDHAMLEDEIFQQIKPGLSSFGDDAVGAAHSLDGLMEAAMKGVPESLRACTPIAVKATAGLRILGPEKSDRILEAIRDRLTKDYPFKLIPKAAVEIMDGKDEGIYAWITVNYLLGSLGSPEHKTAATFDLGGGSTQIVFEPSFEVRDPVKGGPQLAAGEHRYEMAYGGQNYTLYQHSYLGFGLNEARKKVKLLIAQEASDSGRLSVEHPCFPAGFREEVSTKDKKGEVTIKGIMKGSQTPATQEACYKEVRKILNKSAPCAVQPCSFNGVYQPALDQTFAENPFYIFSYFYDRTYPLGVRDEFKLSDVKALMDKVCKHDVALFASKEQQEEVGAENHYCMDLSFQYALLRDGVGMAENRVVRSTRKIKDAETGWCLGASLAVLDQNRYCKSRH